MRRDQQGGTAVRASLSLPLIAGVFTLFVADAAFQIALPTVLVEDEGMTGAQAGTLLSLGLSIGIVITAPVAAWSDRRGRRRIVAAGGAVMLLASAVMLVAGVAWQSLTPWLLAVIVFGLVRTPTTVVLLAYVTEHGDKLRMQSLNSVSQRGAVGVAAGIVSLLTALSALWGVFIAMIVSLLTMLGTTRHMPQHEVAAPPASRTPSTWRALRMLRERPILASSALNTGMVTITILGNAFFPLGLVDRPAHEIAIWVLAFIVTRDLASVCTGLAFRRIFVAIQMRGAMLTIAVCGVSGLVILSLSSAVPMLAVPAAVLQGIASGLGIGCTNLLATSGATGNEGRALRITATQYISAAASLTVPIAFGALFDLHGVAVVFAAAALLCAVLMTVAVQQAWSVGAREKG